MDSQVSNSIRANDKEEGMQVAELAKAGGVGPETIRYYAQMGLLTERKHTNGYRFFAEPDIRRLRFIKTARLLEFRLKEILEFIRLNEHGESPCSCVRDILSVRIDETAEELRRVAAMSVVMPPSVTGAVSGPLWPSRPCILEPRSVDCPGLRPMCWCFFFMCSGLWLSRPCMSAVCPGVSMGFLVASSAAWLKGDAISASGHSPTISNFVFIFVLHEFPGEVPVA